MKTYIASLIILSSFIGITPAFAHRSPDTCTGSGLGISFSPNMTQAHIGDVISYSVTVFNGLLVSPIVCDATNIQASIVTPDGVNHPITLVRTALSNQQSDIYTNVVTYTARAQDVTGGNHLVATASDTGTIHQNDTDSQGGANQGANITVLGFVPPTIEQSSGGGSSGGHSSTGSFLPLIIIEKIADPAELPSGPAYVTYKYVLWNEVGSNALVNPSVADNKCSPLQFISGDSNSDGKLDIGERWNYTCRIFLRTTTTNTVTAIAYTDTPTPQTATASAEATVIVGGGSGTGSLSPLSIPSFPNTGFPSYWQDVWDTLMHVFKNI